MSSPVTFFLWGLKVERIMSRQRFAAVSNARGYSFLATSRTLCARHP